MVPFIMYLGRESNSDLSPFLCCAEEYSTALTILAVFSLTSFHL